MQEVQLLDGVKVVDLSVGMAPALIAKFLADSGATVIRVPPMGGDPFVGYYPAYEVWRRGAVVDKVAAGSASALEALLAEADVCLIGGEDHPEIQRRQDGAQIAARHSRLVVLDITDGPQGTDFAGRPSTDLIAQARSGLVWEQDPARPILNAFEPGNYGAAMQGLAGVLAALYEREASGRGQLVTTSLFEGSLAWIGTYWASLEKPTPAADFVIPRGVWPLVLRARDGVYVHLVIGAPGSKYAMYKALEIDDPSVQPTDVSMPQPGGGAKNFFGDFDLLAEHAAKKDSKDLLEAIWALGLPAEPVLSPGDCWSNPQIERNGVIVTEADGIRRVGLPFLHQTVPAGAAKKPEAGDTPLAGVRVVDCGAFVAGPLAAVMLADLGADVVKVEAKAGDPNRAIFKSFTMANRGKRGLAVDLKDTDGNAVVQALCEQADIVMSNFRPGVAERLGIGAEDLRKKNPTLVVLESPAYGSKGPMAAKAGFDMVMQAWCGHESKAGGRANPPRWNRTNLADIAAGMLGSISLLTALVHRARTGNAVSLESPLVNAGIFTLSELLQLTDGSFAGLNRLSSSLAGYHPAEALYRARDGWVAVVARGEKAAQSLRRLLQLNNALSADVASWDEQAESVIAEAVALRTFADLVELLEPEGIWVEFCHQDREQVILNDAKLIERGMVRAIAHPQFGVINELGTMFQLSRSKTGSSRSTPLLGGSTHELLRELGYSPEKIADLKARGVTLEA